MDHLTSAGNAGTPKQMSAIDQELENVYHQLARVEKSVSACTENFGRFDALANKINPEDYFRNQPQATSDSSVRENKIAENPPQPYVKSGLVLRISELANYAKALEERITQFNEGVIAPTGIFFERNV